MDIALGRQIIAPENFLVCVLDLHKCLEAQWYKEEAKALIKEHAEVLNLPVWDSFEEHTLLSSIPKDHFAWALAESGHPYLLPDAY